MTTYAFTLSPELRKHWYPFNVIEDMWADVKHMIGINTPDCTVSDNDHTLRGHLADLGIDALRLLPAAIIVALAVAGFMVLPVFGINGNQPNTGLAPNAPVIVPPVSNADEPLVWPATPTLTPTNTPTPTPTMTPSPTPTEPLPYAHDMEKELWPICGLLSWPDVRPVFPEKMKVVGNVYLKENGQSLADIECRTYFAIPIDENGDPVVGTGFIFYTLKDEPDTGINSVAVYFTSAYIGLMEYIDVILSVQEADQMWK